VNWLEYHTASQRLAEKAATSGRVLPRDAVARLFGEAALLETKALRALERDKVRTLGVTAVSAVSLYYKASEFQEAERLAFEVMNWPELPSFAGDQIRDLLNAIWSEQARSTADVAFLPGQVLVSVKGGEVVTGGAPLDLVVEKVQTIQAMFIRTAEMLLSRPHRTRGGAPAEIRELCRPWLFQAAPGSYQFAVAIQEPAQIDMFGENRPNAEQISREFMDILRASTVDPATQLPKVVEDPEYRRTFLKLSRNLAPRAKSKVFDEMEVRFPGDQHGVELSSQTRQTIQAALRIQSQPTGEEATPEVTLEGTLRAVHLDEDWLEITVEGKHRVVWSVQEAYDDVVGPLMNRPVVVRARQAKNGKLKLIDIEPAE
jgi:hypothetical protein